MTSRSSRGKGRVFGSPIGGLWTPSDLGPLAIWDYWADNTSQGVTPGLIDEIYDSSGHGITATRRDPAYRASLIVSPTLNNRLACAVSIYNIYRVLPLFTTSSKTFSIWFVGRNLNTATTYQALAQVSGASPMTTTNLTGQMGVNTAGYQSFGVGTSPAGAFARTWEFSDTVVRGYSPAGQVGVQTARAGSVAANNVNPCSLFGADSAALAMQDYEHGRCILVDTVDPVLRANFFAWCADYYKVQT
jgi:hypothetical protein